MINVRDLGDKMKRSLETELDRPEVAVVENDHFKAFVFVVSPSFERMEEGERQERVWGRALHALDRDEQGQIEFIFTDAPSELEG